MDELSRQKMRRANGFARTTFGGFEHTRAAERIAPAVVASPKEVFDYKKTKMPKVHRYRSTKTIAVMSAAVLGITVVFFGVKIVLATNKVITRNNTGGAPALSSGTVVPSKLKGEGDGRVNILLMGIGGAGHPGGLLSDTMMVVSIDPNTKDTAMLSIPRDLWVQIPGKGMSKINAANAYGGPEVAKTVVAKTLDIPIHYYVQLDFQGFKLAVDQVGGINVVNATALNDSGYPCDDGGACPYYLAAGEHLLNGAQALKFARCREGTCGSNYGREDRQRQSLLALRQKAMAISTLTNPVKIASLIDIVGGHLKTDLQIADMAKLATIAKLVDPDSVVMKGLDDYTLSGMVAGQSVVLPKTGNFGEIRNFAHSIFIDTYIKQENASIAVQNGTSRSGLAATVGALLEDTYKYNVVSTTTADNQNYPTTIIFDYSNGKKPYTVNYLATRFGVKVQRATAPAGNVADIKIILGADYHPTVISR